MAWAALGDQTSSPAAAPAARRRRLDAQQFTGAQASAVKQKLDSSPGSATQLSDLGEKQLIL